MPLQLFAFDAAFSFLGLRFNPSLALELDDFCSHLKRLRVVVGLHPN